MKTAKAILDKHPLNAIPGNGQPGFRRILLPTGIFDEKNAIVRNFVAFS